MGLPVKQMFRGNLLFIVCCAFYLAWWLLAFRPAGAVGGMKTGWLLLPAFAAGLAAVLFTLKGIFSAPAQTTLFPGGVLAWGGVAAYLSLLAITRLLFHRPATTELLLIVGWAVLALSEINALYGLGRFSHGLAVGFAAVIGAVLLLHLVCYVLYYRLGARASYIDGMLPLLTAALVMAGISAAMVI